MSASTLDIVAVDLAQPLLRRHLVELLNLYAQDPQGQGAPLAEDVQREVCDRLAQCPHYRGWIAYDSGEPAGLVNAFLGFSTFQARPLLNLHDVTVRPEFRGRGVASALLRAAEAAARELGCCKMTLEIRADNEVAGGVYQRFGFEIGSPSHGFWTKSLR